MAEACAPARVAGRGPGRQALIVCIGLAVAGPSLSALHADEQAPVVVPAALGTGTPEKALASILVPLRGRPDNLPRLILEGPRAEQRVKFEPAGVRLTVPPGFKGSAAHVALNTGIDLPGDFEATVNYEILQLPGPDQAGPETGITLSVRRHQSDMCVAGVTRRVVKDRGSQFSAWATWFEPPGTATRHEEQLSATAATSGRLRLVRTGADLAFYASTRPDAELVQLHRLSIGAQPLDDLRVLGFTGDPRATLDARFWDLRIHRIPAAPAAEPAQDEPVPGAKSRRRLWLTLGVMLALAFAVLAGVALRQRLHRKAGRA